MKKKIRLEIVDLAKQIIENDATFNATLLKNVAGQLYEKLTVLHYLESQIEDIRVVEQKQSLDSKSFREENWFIEPEPLPQSTHKEDLAEPLMEKIKDIVAQMPGETQQIDAILEELLPQKEYLKNELEEFAANYLQTPTFERKEPAKGIDVLENDVSETFPPDQEIKTPGMSKDAASPKPMNLNDKLHPGLNVGLNDKLAFIQHLFDGKTEDYTRVISQIGTMKSYNEAASFIKDRIKPEYNYWLKKDQYSERFMNIIEKSFN
jgi:hypothetical protein